MNISTPTKEALIIGGIVVTILLITLPKAKKNMIPKPETASPNDIKEKENARISLDAYMDAVQGGESAKNLNTLNNELANEYGLRVYKKDGYYIARNLEGKDILAGK